jgi:hypothetical protein
MFPERNSAEKIKEDYTYVCQDIVKEIKKYDTDPYKYFARYAGEHSVTGRVSGCKGKSQSLGLLIDERLV